MAAQTVESEGAIGLAEALGVFARLTPAQQAMFDRICAESAPVTILDLTRITGLHANSIRESVDALLASGLIERLRMPVKGPGRPAWGFVARLREGAATPADIMRHQVRALYAFLRATSSDPVGRARQLGTFLADDALDLVKVPSHEGRITPGFQMSEHMVKIRLFLTNFGMAAEQHPQEPTTLILHALPFSPGGRQDELASALREGFVGRTIERTGMGCVGVRFAPVPGEPKACLARFIVDEKALAALTGSDAG